MQRDSDTGIPERLFYVGLLGGVIVIGAWFDRIPVEGRPFTPPTPPAIEALDLTRPFQAMKGFLFEREALREPSSPNSVSDAGDRADLLAFHRNPSI